MNDLLFRTLLTWMLFIPIVIANGALREKYYKPRVGELAAHQISTGIASVLFVALTYVMFTSIVGDSSVLQLFAAGFVLVLLTVLFEFGFGLFLRHLPLSALLHDYNLAKGRVWALFLLVMLFAPYIAKLLG